MDDKVSQLATFFESMLGEAADDLARECGVVQRERKLTGSLLVQILMLTWWDDPEARWEDMADNAFRWFGLKISPQALNDRAEMPLYEMLRQLCEQAVENGVEAEPTTLPILSRFNGVEIHDGTTISLTSDLHEMFPGCGNQHNSEASAIKFVVRMEVLSGQISATVIGNGREADTKLGPQLPTPEAGSLVMKDRGFFDVSELKRYDEAGVYFLMRPATVVNMAELTTGTICGDNKEPGLVPGKMQELTAFLRSQSADTTEIDRQIELGNERFPCRLIAVRCSEELANRRKQKLRETCKRKGRGEPSESQLITCEWFVLITNVPEEMLTVQEACVVYRVRWQIELLFKCYKSDAGLAKSRARTGSSRLVELMAKWLACLLEHAILAPTGGPLDKTSWRGRVRRVKKWVTDIARALGHRNQLLDVMTKIQEHLKSLRPKAKRKKNPGTLELLMNPELLAECLT